MMASAFTITMILLQWATAFYYALDHALARGSPWERSYGNNDPPNSVAQRLNHRWRGHCDI